MSRLFVAASSTGLTLASAPVNVEPLTMACWWLDNGGVNSLMSLGPSSAAFGYFNLTVDSSRIVHAQTNGSAFGQALSTAGGAANQWNHAAGVWTSNASRTAYLNGGNAATETTTVTQPNTINKFGVGHLAVDTPSNFFGGRIAEAALWNVALSANEIAALALGISPRRIRPLNLVGYWPIFGLDSPEPDFSLNRNGLTLLNAPAQANHAPVDFFSARYWGASNVEFVAAGNTFTITEVGLATNRVTPFELHVVALNNDFVNGVTDWTVSGVAGVVETSTVIHSSSSASIFVTSGATTGTLVVQRIA